MASKVFADANLLLDFTLKRENYEAAREMICHSIDGVIQIYITPYVLHIAAYWTTKTYGSAKSKLILLALLADVQIIDCDHATALVAINSNMNDIEDALQYYTALKFGMDYFISSDKNLKKTAIPQLPVYTAAEFLNDLR
jgi:predicted nucleic acid-binding protein